MKSNTFSQHKAKKLIIQNPRDENQEKSLSIRTKDNIIAPSNISKFITRSEKLEINTTVNTLRTTNNGAQSESSVKIITEIKSDECINQYYY